MMEGQSTDIQHGFNLCLPATQVDITMNKELRKLEEINSPVSRGDCL